MDRNFLLAMALSLLVLSTWTMYQESQLEPVPQGGEARAPESRPEPGAVTPVEEASSASDWARQEMPALPSGTGSAPPAFAPKEDLVQPAMGERIEVLQPLYRAVLNTTGAQIESWELTEYFEKSGAPLMLLEPSMGGGALTPFQSLGLGNLATEEWQLVSSDADTVVFGIEREGVRIRKTYTFDPDSYVARVLLELENGSDRSIVPNFEMRWPAVERPGNDFREQSLAVLQNGEVESVPLLGLGAGGWFSDPEPVQRFDEGEIDWAGSQTPFFLSAMFPDSPGSAGADFVALETSVSGTVLCFFDGADVPSGQPASREYRIYVGPKESSRLEAVGSGADKAIDLGWSLIAPLTGFFVWMLEVLYAFVGNYGWAIILLTLLVRAVTTPLTMKQMKSMERMRVLQPKVKEIQEKYADDRQKQSEEMMGLYRREKVNPLSGCFPLLLQMPVFIGLFLALRSTVALRHAEFFGWIDDLSAPDELFVIPGLELPFRVLPILMAASMVIQQKITPMQADPAQAKMMMTIMPIMMLVICYGFPSGLVLYWMFSNVLAIAHQLYVGRGMRKT